MATKEERDYMRRLGEAKAETHASAAAAHQRRTLAERLGVSFALSAAYRHNPSVGKRVDDPSPFYALARVLGLLDR
jgi:hypothetical protein